MYFLLQDILELLCLKCFIIRDKPVNEKLRKTVIINCNAHSSLKFYLLQIRLMTTEY